MISMPSDITVDGRLNNELAAGGEKSYTTVAFALALGEWTQSPFRAMDEFDVFMDAINRRVAMENLFSNSLEHPDLQFIFLTPQV
jgi:chromosome segregation ATPase